MVSKSQLREEHEQGLDDRPQRIQRLRDEFATYCDLTVPRGVADVEEWYSEKKGVITRRLNESDEEAEEGGGS